MYLLRHTESEFNADPTSTTRDCGLTKEGKRQAAALSFLFVGKILCSPLRRVRETVELARTLYSTHGIGYWDALREVRKDACDFLEDEEMKEESESEILARVKTVLDFLHNYSSVNMISLKKKQPDLLLVGHADFFWYLTSRIGPDGERYGHWMANGEIFVFDVEDYVVATGTEAHPVDVRQTGHLSSPAASGPHT